MGAWTITCKELRLLARDRRALTILLLMPVLVIGILGFTTGKLLSRRDENSVLRLSLVDQDHGALAAELIQALRGRSGIDIVVAEDRQAAQDEMDDGKRAAAVIIGADFARCAESLGLRDVLEPTTGKLAEGLSGLDISVMGKSSLVITREMVEQAVLSEALSILLPHIGRREPVVRGYLGQHRPAPTSLTVEDRSAEAAEPVASPPVEDNAVYQVLVPSYAVLFTFFLINVMARSFVHERQIGTLYRLRVGPIGTASLLAGQTAPFFMVSVAQGVLLFVFGRLLFGMSWGPMPAMLLPVLACTSLAATGLGLLTATLVRSEAEVSAYANLVVIGFAGISGCFMPRDWLPEAVRQVSLATPHAWALMAYDQLLTHPAPNLARVWLSCAALIAFAAGFALVAWWRFRRVA